MIIKRDGRDVMVCDKCGVTEDGDTLPKEMLGGSNPSITIDGEHHPDGQLFCPECGEADMAAERANGQEVIEIAADDPGVVLHPPVNKSVS